MALYKPFRQPDGVITNYHRVLFVNHVINDYNSIAVISYVDDESRGMELASIENPPYRQSITYMTDYDPNMTAETAYDYLKTLPQFEGATDI